VPFPFEEYQAMAKLMREIKGKALLSINDHPQIRECFAGLPLEEVPIKYTVGGGQGVDRMELLISSWDMQAEPAGLF
jgi:DNA adenine methylase